MLCVSAPSGFDKSYGGPRLMNSTAPFKNKIQIVSILIPINPANFVAPPSQSWTFLVEVKPVPVRKGS